MNGSGRPRGVAGRPSGDWLPPGAVDAGVCGQVVDGEPNDLRPGDSHAAITWAMISRAPLQARWCWRRGEGHAGHDRNRAPGQRGRGPWRPDLSAWPTRLHSWPPHRPRRPEVGRLL